MIYTAGHLIETAEDRFERRMDFALRALLILGIAAVLYLRPDVAELISARLP